MGNDQNWQCFWYYWAFDLHIVFINILCWLTGTEPPLSAVSQMLTCSVVKWPFSPNSTVLLSSALWVLAWMIPAWVKTCLVDWFRTDLLYRVIGLILLLKFTWVNVILKWGLIQINWAQCIYLGNKINCLIFFPSIGWFLEVWILFVICVQVVMDTYQLLDFLSELCHRDPVCSWRVPVQYSSWTEKCALCVLNLSVKYCRLSYFHSIIHLLLCSLHSYKYCLILVF